MIETVVEHRSMLGEGPVWDFKKNAICWVDIIRGEIYELQASTGFFTSVKLNQLVGAAAICKSGHFLAGLKNGIAIVHRETGEIRYITHPEAHLTTNRYNDGKCDPSGRFWIGTMSLNELPEMGSVYMLEGNSFVAKKIEYTSISNGMAWSPDHKLFYFIDSPTFSVVCYKYDNATGINSNRKVVIRITEKDGMPDGMTIDEEGMLWIAHWGGWQISRWNPFSGEKIFSIPVPAANVTSCVFGGESLRDIYITTAMKGLTESELVKQPQAGSLFVYRNSPFKGLYGFEFDDLMID